MREVGRSPAAQPAGPPWWQAYHWHPPRPRSWRPPPLAGCLRRHPLTTGPQSHTPPRHHWSRSGSHPLRMRLGSRPLSLWRSSVPRPLRHACKKHMQGNPPSSARPPALCSAASAAASMLLSRYQVALQSARCVGTLGQKLHFVWREGIGRAQGSQPFSRGPGPFFDTTFTLPDIAECCRRYVLGAGQPGGAPHNRQRRAAQFRRP